MSTLFLLVGPIASGKSTFCRQRAELGDLIVNDDSIVTAIHGGIYSQYSKDLKFLYKQIENTIIMCGLTCGRNVVIDRPNHNPVTRQRYISLAKSLDKRVIGVLFPRYSPDVHAKRRFNSDPRGLLYERWLESAERHEAEFRSPTISEGFDDIIKVEVLCEKKLWVK